MKKSIILFLSLIICICISACAPRRHAPKQLDQSPYLRVDGTQIVDADGQSVTLASKRITVTAEDDFGVLIKQAVADDDFNAVTLDISGELIEDELRPWKLCESAELAVDTALKQCADAGKYLLVDISDYPQAYRAWYEDSDFTDGVIDVWSQIAEKVKDQSNFAAYLLSGLPRPGASENHTALEYYEEFLTEVVQAIRQFDPLHIVALGSITPYSPQEDEFLGLPLVKDPNFALCAQPEALWFYTRQTRKTEQGSEHLNYPSAYLLAPERLTFEDRIVGSDLDFSFIDYQTRATEVFKVDEENLFARIGVGVFPPDSNGGGELRVWEVRFTECDASGEEKRVLYETTDTVDLPFIVRSDSGIVDDGSIYEDDGSAYLESVSEGTFFYIRDLNIPVEKDKYYQLTVTMKQRGMNKQFDCAPMVELFLQDQCKSFDKSYLAEYCEQFFVQAKKMGVALIYEDIGVTTFAQSRGGEQFVKDMREIVSDLGQHYIEN